MRSFSRVLAVFSMITVLPFSGLAFADTSPLEQRLDDLEQQVAILKRQIENNKEFCLNGSEKIQIDYDKHVVCINGAVFQKRKSPTIQMLMEVFADRKKNKKIMMQKKEEYYSTLNEIKLLEEMLSSI